MHKRSLISAGVAAVVALTLAACGSSAASNDSSGGATSGSASPIKLGVLTSLTGGYASAFTTVEKGVKARIELANSEGGVDGHKLSYVMADDASTPAGALSAVQKLIKQDKVFAILDVSPSFYGALSAVKDAGVPVLGSSFDGGPEWLDMKGYPSLFDGSGYLDYSRAATTWGTFFKSQGCTKVGTIGNTGPSSGRAAEAAVISAEKAGLQRGYVNTKLPPGSTDVGPTILGVKSSGTDCLYSPVPPNSAFQIAAGLKQAGVQLKSLVLATGYGQELLDSDASVEAAQGISFSNNWAPVETKSQAAEQFSDALNKYAGVTGSPGLGMSMGWTMADLFIYGVSQNDGELTQANFVSSLRSSTTWDDGGLFAKTVNFADPVHASGGLGPGNCIYVVKVQGKAFVPVDGAAPVCGDLITGVTISS